MRDKVISNCEKNFLIRSLEQHTRLDGRAFEECREVSIHFGKEWGSCLVSLGQTRVLAKVSCEIQQPKSSRPNEGLFFINVECNPMTAPNFELGRPAESAVQLNRILEKCLKDSKAIDLESLCIKLNEKVWFLRVDITVLNHEGNMLDCASIAALSALAHFRRPDVTSDGEEIIVHALDQRDPIPLVLHHYPVCVTSVIFNNGAIVVYDPTFLEESTAEAQLIFGINAYKELCTTLLCGTAKLSPAIILKCTHRAAARAAKVIADVKNAIAEDAAKRERGEEISYQDAFERKEKPAKEDEAGEEFTKPPSKSKKRRRQDTDSSSSTNETATVVPLCKDSAMLLPSKSKSDNKSEWAVNSEDDSSDSDIVMVEKPYQPPVCISDGSGSEEDEVKILNPINFS